MAQINLSRMEASITTDVLSLVLNDPDWQQLASATDEEWAALGTAVAKIFGSLRA